MRILEITLDGMGCFTGDSGTLNFDADRVVVFGPNEAGKSTLMRAISALIFGFDHASEEARWKPWGGCLRFGGRIRFEVNGNQYDLDREWDRDFVILTGNGNMLFNAEFNPRSRKAEPFRDVISKILPLTESEMFHRLSFIKQEELATDISEDLRQRITGSGRKDALDVLKQLHEKYSELTWEKPPWGTKRLSKKRIIEILDDEIREKRIQRNDAKDKLQQASHIDRRLSEINLELPEIQKQYTTYQDTQEDLIKLSNLLLQEESVKKELATTGKRLQDLNDLIKQKDNTEAKLKDEFVDFASAPDDTSRSITLFIDGAKRKTDKEEQLETEKKQEIDNEPVSKKYLIPVPLAIFVAGIVGAFAGYLLLYIIIGIIIGISVAAIWRIFINKIVVAQKETLERSKEKLQKEIDSITREMKEIFTKLLPILDNHGPEDALTKWNQYEKLKGDLEGLNQAIEQYSSIDEIQVEHEITQAKFVGIQKELKQLFDDHAPLKQFEDKPIELDKEINRLHSECNILQDKINELNQEKENLKLDWARVVGSGVDDLEWLEEEIKTLEKRQIDYKRQRDALLLASDCMAEAIDSIRDEHKGVIEERLDALFNGWTGNPDRTVVLDDFWNPLIEHKLNPEVTPNELSRGTMDQLYLAYRVALSEALSRDVPLPFLLDDPFVHFDPERRELARKAFEAISERHQVILFTQDPGFKDWGKLVLLK